MRLYISYRDDVYERRSDVNVPLWDTLNLFHLNAIRMERADTLCHILLTETSWVEEIGYSVLGVCVSKCSIWIGVKWLAVQ